MYANPETGENDPSIIDRTITVTFTYASDDEHDPQMRGELVDRINALAEDAGCGAEIHTGEEIGR